MFIYGICNENKAKILIKIENDCCSSCLCMPCMHLRVICTFNETVLNEREKEQGENGKECQGRSTMLIGHFGILNK